MKILKLLMMPLIKYSCLWIIIKMDLSPKKNSFNSSQKKQKLKSEMIDKLNSRLFLSIKFFNKLNIL